MLKKSVILLLQVAGTSLPASEKLSKNTLAENTLSDSVRAAEPFHPDFGLDDHALNCAWQGERIAKHNSLRGTLHSTEVKTALGPTKEGQYPLLTPSKQP